MKYLKTCRLFYVFIETRISLYGPRHLANVATRHGSTDRHVPSDEAEKLGDVFRRTGTRSVNVRVLPGLNHLLVPDAGGDFTCYDRLPSAVVDAQVLGAIADWMAALRRKP